MPKNISHPLSNDDTQRIQRNWSFLKQNLEQNEIRDTFIDNGVWDVSDCDEIDAGKTSEEKNEVFLKLLLDSGPKAYEMFKKALHKTNSTYIIEELEKTQLLKDDTDHLTAVSNETAQPLSCEERIRRNWSFLKENLKQKRIRDKFIDSGIWDVCAFDDIDAQKTGLEKNEMFLNQLIKSGSKGYAVFIAALEEKGSTHIIKRLQDTPIRMDVDSSEQSDPIFLGEKISSSDVVAAIDFGTAYSGYAFSFLEDYNREPYDISTNPWNKYADSYKIPTSILFDAEKNFVAFGDEAEQKYPELKKTGCYFYQKFKMVLFDGDYKKHKRLTKQTLLCDINGKEMLAIDVFSAAVKNLMEQLLNALKKNINYKKEKKIKWVITVPGIWGDAAKQFMRDAAEKAGIEERQLIIALEPEVASFFCIYLPRAKMKTYNMLLHDFQPGTQYLIMDAGGGTVDTCVHKRMDGGMIEEVVVASGGAWGGSYVDRKFLEMFETIIGKEEFEAYRTENTDDYLKLCQSLELGKRNFTTSSKRFPCGIPTSLDLKCINAKKSSFKELLFQSVYKDFAIFEKKNGILKLDVKLMQNLFDYVCNGIVDHLKNLLQKTETQSILMVGGFSMSPYLQEKIKDAFPDHEIMIPDEAWLSVVKGAVLYGHFPKGMRSRIAKCSYGVETLVPFEPEVHPPERLKIMNGREYCSGIFSKHVTVYEELRSDIIHNQKIYYPVHQHKETWFHMFTSSKDDPQFVDDEECKYLACVCVNLPQTVCTESLTFRIAHVETELKVEVSDSQTGDILESKLDYFEMAPESRDSCDIRI